MRPRDVLAANLKKLMAATPSLARFPQITEASGGALTNGTLDRVRRATNATSIDTLEALAEVFGLEPWQLLVPSLQVESSAAGEVKVSGLPDWPFARVQRSSFLALEPEDRAYIEGVLASQLERISLEPTEADIQSARESHVRVRKPATKRRAA